MKNKKLTAWQKVFTLGFGNLLDEKWTEICKICDTKGLIKVKIKEY